MCALPSASCIISYQHGPFPLTYTSWFPCCCEHLKQNPHPRIYLLILEGEGGGEKERETSISCLPYMPRTRDQTHNRSMCPDWEWDLQPFGVRDDAPAS